MTCEFLSDNGGNGQDALFYIGADRLPAEMKTLFSETGICSMLMLPVRIGGQPAGYVMLCDYSRLREDWESDPAARRALSYLTRVLSVFLQ